MPSGPIPGGVAVPGWHRGRDGVEVPGRKFAAGVIVCPSGSFERERDILDAGVRRMRRGRA